MDELDLDLVMSNINEVYFGKTEIIKQIEHEMHLLRKYYMGSNRIPINDPHLMNINKLVEEGFGFGRFNLLVTYDVIPSANTLPMSYNLNISKKKSNYMVDLNGYKFKKEYNYKCVIIMTTALIFNPLFTDEEIMACLLYELGHNFFSAFSSSNAVLSDIYIVGGLAKKAMSVVLTFLQTKKAVEALRNKAARDTADRLSLKDINSEPELLATFNTLNDKQKRAYLDTFGKPYYDKANKEFSKDDSTIIGTTMAGTLLSLFMNSDLYNRFKTMIRGLAYKGGTVQFVTISLSRRISLFIKYGLSYASNLISMFYQNDKSKKALATITIKDILFPMKALLAQSKNPLTWLMMPVDFKVEQSAASFATMYGYGAPLVSYMEKMKSNKRIEVVQSFLQKHPLVSISYDCLTLPMRIIYGVFDPNPSNLSRCYDQIEMLSRELQKSDLTDDMKQSLLEDIAACRIQIKELTNLSNGFGNPDICKVLYNKLLDEIFNGVGLNEFLFSSKKRFNEYDMNAQLKSNEDAIDMDFEVRSLIEGGLLTYDPY